MGKEEKLKLLLKRKEKADGLTPKEKLRWKNEIIKIEQEIKALKLELEREQLTEEEKIILDIFSLNKAAALYLYESYIAENTAVIEEFINEILAGIYDYFKTNDIEHLEKSKAVTNVLLDTIYQNHIEKINEGNKQLEFIKTNEPTPWG
ncbi:hypothetical protein [Alkaliphilus oremlandii]|uniref:Uncharacterized protein n=1 Tax=Alkaliphilus oremlandii (strain OhILAs) TaxID=350688 RepID=A8MGB2_ALKOO|nr:hypothetical protein [Alkaliphilus oremlandii]ABW18840.1 hypothetical protein Clos_1295 [Alkaliphilus oremlandii OhILAs]